MEPLTIQTKNLITSSKKAVIDDTTVAVLCNDIIIISKTIIKLL